MLLIHLLKKILVLILLKQWTQEKCIDCKDPICKNHFDNELITFCECCAAIYRYNRYKIY